MKQPEKIVAIWQHLHIHHTAHEKPTGKETTLFKTPYEKT